MKQLKLLAVLLFSVIIFTGCGVKNNETIVKVNDSVITQADFDELFTRTANNPALQMFGLDAKQKDKKGFMYTMIKDKVIKVYNYDGPGFNRYISKQMKLKTLFNSKIT